MKILKTLLMSISIANSGLAQVQYSHDDILNKTIMLENPGGAATGTGFVIKKDTKYFLCSADHVFAVLQVDASMVFKNDKNSSDKLKLLDIASPLAKDNQKSPEGDARVLLLTPHDENQRKILDRLAIDFSCIPNKAVNYSRSLDVFVYGFPMHNENYVNFQPWSFGTYMSSGVMAFNRGDTKTRSLFYVLQNPSMQGFSGGPAFFGIAKEGGYFGPKETVLFGLVHGTIPDATGGKFAAITPTAYIYEIISQWNW